MDQMAEIRLQLAQQHRRNQAREAAEDRLAQGAMRRSRTRNTGSQLLHMASIVRVALQTRGRIRT
jgi:hypothetical protein